jgi:hypothetical protein
MKKFFAVVILSGSLLWTQQAAAWIPVVVNAVATVVKSCASNVTCRRVVTSIVSIGGTVYTPSATAEARVNSSIAENKQKITLFKCPNSDSLYTHEEVSEHCKTELVVVNVDL